MEPRDIELIRALQDEEIFLMQRPFEEAARRLGWGLQEVLERAAALKGSGVIRRFGAALTPRNAGFKANSMVVWEIAEEKAMEAGNRLAGHPRVSHCYIRPCFDGFPYNVYTMAHGNDPEDLERIVLELAGIASAASYRTLDSLKEFKKSSPVYFPRPTEPAGA
ncbi:MAG TPA: Lrp/AsnC family transcriptional regulator [Deltaproteobacteria bacterium]|nr:MAG: hypothetical protein A2Z79_12320 [Deltaproteobacteria bacterium GWA2_55_82]OGQ64017.1 MAG: hypothetical protein A3I81_07850 [Deltaproteobacteria bacterium RIFCSPLOWO2_02_FULL_55_12]OIJ75034.1 MAG: hypothetical protein A2V21_303390 [Deltaproteobacteria bacterium GWC2_55_46]HBG47249.1 Lrp/AsnC family transcriptional regulator [Deltaproteobacteria bacterium]HCY10015.1 Lrp/AsnC family transcriptional regulator [Deltaproteobacteria bacterium]